MAATATVTILFTDLVGSTALLGLGSDVADHLRRAHTAAIRDALTRHRGIEVKGTGDGVMASFGSAADAVAAGIAIQQAVHRLRAADDRHPGVRVGISTGEAVAEDGDWFGPPVIEAARLVGADHAGAGEILATAVVAALVGRRDGVRFSSLEPRRLKGFDEPIDLVQIEWHAEPASAPIPAPLAAMCTEPLIGRAAARAQLHEVWTRAATGVAGPRLALITGEPGIGKTRLVAEVAQVAHAEGALVLFGRCDEDLDLPYQPFVEALAGWRTDAPAEVDTLIPMGLGRLLDPIELGPVGLTPRGDAAWARAEMFQAVTLALRTAADHRPLLVALDDLQWAGSSTLALLRHVLLGVVGQRVLVVGTSRDEEAGRPQPLAALLADLGREGGGRRIALDGLGPDDIADFVTAAQQRAGGEPTGPVDAAVIRRLYDQTAGNPFFLTQILDHLGAALDGAGESAELPEGVRDAVGRRLASLPDAARPLLAAAAVMGPAFELDVIERVIEPEADPLDLLDGAVAAKLVREVMGRPGRYAFVHAIVRQTLLAELTAARRARLHRRVGEVLAAQGADVAVLAHHFCAGATSGTASDAIEWSLQAAVIAESRFAFDQAHDIIERAMRVLDLVDRPRPGDLCRLELALARDAAVLGDIDGAKRWSMEAADDARRAGDGETFTVAALVRTMWAEYATPDPDGRRLCEEALRMASDQDVNKQVTLLATLALYDAICESHGTAVTPRLLEALEIGRGTNDPAVWALPAMQMLIVHAGGPDLDLQQRMVDLLAGIEGTLEPPDFRVPVSNQLFHQRIVLALQRGDHLGSVDALERGIEAHRGTRATAPTQDHESVADRMAAVVAMCRGCHALNAGDLADAERWNRELAGVAGSDRNLMASWGGQLFRLRRAQGRLDELLDLYRHMAAAEDHLPVVVTSLAIVLLDRGDLDGAAALVDAFLADGLTSIPPDQTQAVCLADMAEVAIATRDRAWAELLHEQLVPYAGQVLVLSWGVATLGAADSFLGALDAMCGRVDQAVSRLRSGRELEERGSRCFVRAVDPLVA